MIIAFLCLILSIFLFILGLIFGVIILILILFLLSLKKIPNESQKKNKRENIHISNDSIQSISQEEKKFNFGESTQLYWMNRLLWRAYPLLLDRHYIKVQIMEVFDQIPKDIPQIKKLKLAQFKTGMTPLVLDNASIHIIPKSQLVSTTDAIRKSNSSALINLPEQQYPQHQAPLFSRPQRSYSTSSAPLEIQISHSKSNSNFDLTSFKQSNKTQTDLTEDSTTKINNLNESLPPGFSIIKKIVEGNKNCTDYLKFCFHFEPDLEIGAEVELGIRLLSSIPVAANFKLHSLSGHFIVAIPPKSGRLSIGILESTLINFDITAHLGVISFNSEEWKNTWTSLKNWIHYFLHKIVINIPLEEILQKLAEEGESEKEVVNEIDSEKERELMLQKIRERKKQKQKQMDNSNNINTKLEEKVQPMPSSQNLINDTGTNNSTNTSNPVNANNSANTSNSVNTSNSTNINNSTKNQKQLIIFKHSMTLWDYEF